MQQLFVLKKVDNVNHLIGKLIRNDDGDFEIENLLKTEGSEVFQIPALAEQSENSEKLMNWIVSFMPPIGNDAFTQALMMKFDIREFEPMTWLKCYKPDGRSTISFCEFLPHDCVRHDNADFDEEFGDYPVNVSYEDSDDNCDDYFDDEYFEEGEADEEDPCYIVGETRCDSFPVYPENIPPEQPVTNAKEFARRCDTFRVENLRTIHNALGALSRCPVTDFLRHNAQDDFAKSLQIPAERIDGLTINELVKQFGHLINVHIDVPAYYPKLYIDFFGFLSYDFRSFAFSQTISI